jgi:hypothetical protein
MAQSLLTINRDIISVCSAGGQEQQKVFFYPYLSAWSLPRRSSQSEDGSASKVLIPSNPPGM